MQSFAFHQDVITPNGPGVIQGWNPKTATYMVSHKPDDIPVDQWPTLSIDKQPEKKTDKQEYPGMWILKFYLPEQLKAKGTGK